VLPIDEFESVGETIFDSRKLRAKHRLETEIGYFEAESASKLVAACQEVNFLEGFGLLEDVSISGEIEHHAQSRALEVLLDLGDFQAALVAVPAGMRLQEHVVVHFLKTIFALPSNEDHFDL
jgi:hypothetical protein